MTLGEDPVAHLKHLRVSAAALHGDRDQVGAVERLAGDASALHQRPHGLEAVAVDRRPLELLGSGRLGHLPIQIALDIAVAAREEVDDRLDVSPVLLAVDVPDAGRLASLDVVIEAWDPRPATRLGPLAGAVLEQLAEQVEGLSNPPGAREGAEVDPPGTVALAGEVHPRVLLIEADAHVGIGLVVAQPDIEPWPVALDELLLGEQRLGLGLGDQEVDRADPVDERKPAAVRP